MKRRSANHILRDDVIIELAKLKITDPDRLAALRSIHRRSDAAMYVQELPKIVARGLAIPDFALPEIPVNFSFPNYPIAASWLLAVLHNEAKKRDLSPNILAVPQDARELVASYAGTLPPEITPRLMTGWRRISRFSSRRAPFGETAGFVRSEPSRRTLALRLIFPRAADFSAGAEA